MIRIIFEIASVVYEWANTKYQKLEDKGFKLLEILIPAIILAYLTLKQLVEALISSSGSDEQDGDVIDASEDSIVNKVLGHEAVITSEYGADRSFNRSKKQIAAGNTKHKGVDLRAKEGDPVYAPFDGVVIRAKSTVDGAGGRTVIMKSNTGQVVMMCHLSAVFVKTNEVVHEGRQVGTVGGSGNGKEHAYKPHLHLQVGRYKGSTIEWVNPVSTTERINIANPKLTYGVADKDTIGKTVSYLAKGLNLNAKQASGIVGNLLRESGLNPSSYNPAGGGIGAHGIAQWRAARAYEYKSIYGKFPSQDPKLQHQLDFLIREFKGAYSGALSELRRATNEKQAADIVLGRYEFSKGVQDAVRRVGSTALSKGRQYATYALQCYQGVKEKSKDNVTVHSSRTSQTTKSYNRYGT